MNEKGLAAMLDGLLAYSVAFLAIGLIVLLMTDMQDADSNTMYTLNVWAEDLANAVGESAIDPADPSVAWRGGIPAPILEDLNTSLNNIAREKGLSISVEIGNSELIDIGSIENSQESAIAKRLLINPANEDVTILTVTVGIP